MENINTVSVGSISSPVPAANPPGQNAVKTVDKAASGDNSLPTEAQMEKIIAEIRDTISPLNIDLKFSCYGPKNQYLAVTVINKETGDVVREIPSAEMQELYSKSSDLSGLILNNSI